MTATFVFYRPYVTVQCIYLKAKKNGLICMGLFLRRLFFVT